MDHAATQEREEHADAIQKFNELVNNFPESPHVFEARYWWLSVDEYHVGALDRDVVARVQLPRTEPFLSVVGEKVTVCLLAATPDCRPDSWPTAVHGGRSGLRHTASGLTNVPSVPIKSRAIFRGLVP